MGFIFGGNTGAKTPEDLKRQRDIVKALMANQRAPRDVGEGINALGDGIVAAVLGGRADKAEKAGLESASANWNNLSGAFATPASFPPAPGQQATAAPQAAYAAPVDIPSQRVAQAFGDKPESIPPQNTGFSGVARAGKGWTEVQTADGQTIRREGARNWRNNNPGNIEYGKLAKSMGAVGTDGRFAVFPTLEAGREAKERLLFEGAGYRDKTLAGAISRWAPPFENDTNAYIGAMASAAGVSPNTPLSSFTPEQRTRALAAMERIEGFRPGRETPTGGRQPMQVASLDPSVGMPADRPLPPEYAKNGTTQAQWDKMNEPDDGLLPPSQPDPTAAIAAALGSQPQGQPGVDVGAPGAVTDAGQRVIAQMLNKQPMGGPQLQQPVSDPQQQIAQTAGKPQGPGKPGEIRRGADGKNYQYAETTGMAGATGGQGWIETNMAPQGQGDPNIPVMAGGSGGAITRDPQGGPDLQMLMQSAGNQWMNPTQQGIIEALLGKQMQANDPLRQLQIQKAQKDLAVPAKQWQKLDDNTLFDPASGETKQIGAPGSEPLFSGNSVEAQSLNGLVSSGALTKEQALQLGAGKTVTDPSTGAILFMTPQGIFAKPTDGGQPQPIQPKGQQSSVQPPANPGMIPITGPKEAGEGERNAMTFADRMTTSGQIIDKLSNAGLSNKDQFIRGNDWIPDLAENQMVGEDFQKFDQARRDFINAQLRRESGAVISPEEFDNANKQYFPYPGDTPALLEQKRKNRETVIKGMARAGGPTYQPQPAAPDAPKKRLKFNPATGELE